MGSENFGKQYNIIIIMNLQFILQIITIKKPETSKS